MSFTVSNKQNIHAPSYLAGPINPQAINEIVITSNPQSISLGDLMSSDCLSFTYDSTTVGAGPYVVNLASTDAELASLFTTLQVGSVRQWIIYTYDIDTPAQEDIEIVLTGATGSGPLTQTASNRVNILYLICTAIGSLTTDPTFMLGITHVSSSITSPTPIAYTVPASFTSGVLGGSGQWNCINASGVNAMSVCLIESAASGAGTLTCGSGFSLYNRLFGASTLSSALQMVVVNIFIINNTASAKTIASTNTTGFTDSSGGAITIKSYQNNNVLDNGSVTKVMCSAATAGVPAAGILIPVGGVCELIVKFTVKPTSNNSPSGSGGSNVVAFAYGILYPALV
jgi:hypothetical protein